MSIMAIINYLIEKEEVCGSYAKNDENTVVGDGNSVVSFYDRKQY